MRTPSRPTMPRSWDEFADHRDGMLRGGELFVTPRARELAVDIVLRAPVPRRRPQVA